MPSPEGKTPFRFAFIVLGICSLTIIGSYFYSVWAAAQEEKALLPKLAAAVHGRVVQLPMVETGA